MQTKAFPFAALLCASSLTCADSTYSLSGQISEYDDIALGEQRSYELPTREYSLAWRYLPESGPSFSASYWWSDADTNWNNLAELIREQDGVHIALSQAIGESGYRIGLHYAQSSMDTRLETASGSPPYVEEIDTWSGMLVIDRSWYFDAFSLSPSLGMRYLHDTLERIQHIAFLPNVALNQRDTEKTLGWSLEAGLSLGYDISLSEEAVLTPWLSLNWSEPLSLDNDGSQSGQLSTANGRASRTRHSTYGPTLEESLSAAAGLSWMWRDWLLDLSWSDTIHPDENDAPSAIISASLSWLY